MALHGIKPGAGFLAIDIGNTETSFGLFDGAELRLSWRTATDIARTGDDLGLSVLSMLRLHGLDPDAIGGVGIASVVPPATGAATETARRYLGHEPVLLSAGLDLGIAIAYRRPEEVGADRLANAVAAVEHLGAPVIVVDFGTATTFDVVSPAREYLGGVIVPGVLTGLEALFHRASKLPRIELERPERVIAQSTVEAVRSGVVYGTGGQVDRLVELIRAELQAAAPVVATGGLAPFLAPYCTTIERVEPALTLEGIRLASARLAGSATSRPGGELPPPPSGARATAPHGRRESGG